jgi:hypothetical protein
MAIQKSDAEEATEQMAAVIKGAQAAGGKGLSVVITKDAEHGDAGGVR